MDSFIIYGENNTNYIVGKDFTVTKESTGYKMKLTKKGRTFGFQQSWKIKGKSFSKYHQVGQLYAEHFIPNPKGLDFVNFKKNCTEIKKGCLVWSERRIRRTILEITTDRLFYQHKKALEEKEKKALEEKERNDELSVSSSNHDPLAKHFLKKKHCTLEKYKVKKPKYDKNFKLIGAEI